MPRDGAVCGARGGTWAGSCRRTVGFALLYAVAAWLGLRTSIDAGGPPMLAIGPGVAALWLRSDLRNGRRVLLDGVLVVGTSLVVFQFGRIAHVQSSVYASANLGLAILYAYALNRWMPQGVDLTTPRTTGRLLTVCWVGALLVALPLAVLYGGSGWPAEKQVLLLGSFTARFATGTFLVFACAAPLLHRTARRDLQADAANPALGYLLVAMALLELAMRDSLGFPALLLLLALLVSVASWFSPTLTAWSVAATSAILVLQTSLLEGPFADSDAMAQAAYTQFYVGVLCGVTMLQASLRGQRDELMATVSATVQLLERQLASTAESERMYRLVFDRAPLGGFVLEPHGQDYCRILSANAEAAAILGLSDSTELSGQSLVDWAVVDQREVVASLVRDEYLYGSCGGELDVRLHDATGREIVVRLVAARVSSALTDEPHVIALIEDVTALRLAQQRLEEAALHDTLTQLPNRRLFSDRLGQAVAASARESEPVGVLYLDLDGFKKVNDTYGHAVGDELLRHVSSRLRSTVRPGDTAARLGGDEFALLCPHIDTGGLLQVAERVVENLSRPVELSSGLTVRVGASVGAAQSRPAQSPEELVREADAAMYAAKRSGPGEIRLGSGSTTGAAVPAQRSADAVGRR